MGKASRGKRERRIAGSLRLPSGREVPLNEEDVTVLKKMDEEFVNKFGRKPGPGDPLFWDPDADTPQPLSEEKVTQTIIDGMVKAGIPAKTIYAYRKTGILLTTANQHLVSEADLKAWNDAINEYERLTSQKH
jgi:hypothetical protein